jgi:transglutaminase-like putative cysteine protease
MRDLVNQHASEPLAQGVAHSLYSQSRSLTDFTEKCFLLARDGVRYENDPPPFERITGFPALWEIRAGDCDDKVIFACTLLKAAGVPCNFVAQSYNAATVDKDGFDHVYCEAFIDGQWVGLDPTADGHRGSPQPFGWRQPLSSRGAEHRYPV